MNIKYLEEARVNIRITSFLMFTMPLLLLSFQNCGQGFTPYQNASLSNGFSEDEDGKGDENNDEGGFPPNLPPVELIDEVDSKVTKVLPVNIQALGFAQNRIFQRAENNHKEFVFDFSKINSTELFYYKIVEINQLTQMKTLLSVGKWSQQKVSVHSISEMNEKIIRVQFFDDKGFEHMRFDSVPFAVGDVFVVGGQSNAAGHGETPSQAESLLSRSYDPVTNKWVHLKDPLPFASNYSMAEFGSQPNSRTGSPWPFFANEYTMLSKVPVAVISTAWGGSTLSHWLVGGSDTYKNGALKNRLTQVAKAIQCDFKMVLWHQGESDALQDLASEKYLEQLDQLRYEVAKDSGCLDKKWMVARATYLPNHLFSDMTLEKIFKIREGQTQVWKEKGFIKGPDTDLMIGLKYRWDEVHFSTVGLKTHGNMWAKSVYDLVTLGLPESATFDWQYTPEASELVKIYKVVLERTDSDMKYDYQGLFYSVYNLVINKKTIDQIKQEFINSDEKYARDLFWQCKGRKATIEEIYDLVVDKARRGVIKNRDQLKAQICP